jgi:hypothetical protein
MFIGSNPDRFDVVAPFNGIIDEFRIWNVARTDIEIQATMNQSLNGNEPGLVGYWKFDEGTGSTTADLSSNGNDGTISGALWVSGTSPVEEDVNFAKSYSLSQNYPNPFNPVTKIRFSLPNPSEGGAQTVKLIIYDILGQVLETLVNDQLKPGTYEVEWDGSNFSSGVYYYSLVTQDFTQTRKMVLIK